MHRLIVALISLSLGLVCAVALSRRMIPTAHAVPPPVSTVYVSKTNGEVEQVTVSSGAHAVVGATGAGSADSLVFEPSGKLIVTGLGSPNVFRVDPTLPGGSANTGTQVNTSPLSGFSADPAIDSGGTKSYVTNFSNSINVVDLTTGTVSTHLLTATTGSLSEISGISFDALGQLWVTDYIGDTVGIADLVANTYTPLCSGVAVGAGGPDGLSFDPSSGKLYVSGQARNTITQLTIGPATCVAGTVFPMGVDSASNIIRPDGIAADGLGDVFAAGQNGDVVKLDTSSGIVTVIASGIAGLDDIAPVFGLGQPPTPTPTSTGTATNTPTGTSTATTTATPTPTTTNTATVTSTNTPTVTSTNTRIPTKTATPTATPTTGKCGNDDERERRDRDDDERCCNSKADFDHNGVIDFRDLAELVEHFGKKDLRFDLNNDRKVDARDVAVFLKEKEKCKDDDDE